MRNWQELGSREISHYFGANKYFLSSQNMKRNKLKNKAFAITLASFGFASASANAAEIYVAPGGNDSAAGTITAPLKTVAKAYQKAAAGDIVYLRGGTYPISSQILLNKSGKSGMPIRITAYGQETPVIDASAMTQSWDQGAAVLVTGSYNTLAGVEVKNAANFGVMIGGAGSNNTLERLNVHGSGRYSDYEGKGIVIYGTAANNSILNCDSHHNRDRRLGNADGFHVGSRGTGNVLRGNRAYRNSDDGFDLYDGAAAIVENNVSFENGYDDNYKRLGDGNGFKLGGHHSGGSSGGHLVRNNLAFSNPLHGFDENGASRSMTLLNNTAFNNGPSMPGGESWGENFYFPSISHTFKNNLIVGGSAQAKGSNSNNSWNLNLVASASDFLSLDYSSERNPRRSDGALPASNFLRLAASSKFIDRGVATGHPFAGAAPDLGSFEYAAVVAPPPSSPVGFINGGFESKLQAWENFGNSASVTGNKSSGARSLRVGRGEGGVGQKIANVQANTNYTLSAVGKMQQGVDEGCYVGIDFKDASGREIAGTSVLMHITAGSFTRVSANVRTPRSFATARIFVWKDSGSRYCFVDEIAFSVK